LRKETQDELKQKQQNSESSHTAINAHPDELKAIIHAQHYRPCDWRETDQRINYRRFFTVNGLICLNIHQDNVFHAYHQLTEKLLKKKILQGLRVDHVDGLYDPSGYLESLRGLAGEDTYVVVEKILQRNEELPHYWPIQGTTGYDFLAMTNKLLTGRLPAAFNRFYNYLTKHSGTDSPNADPRLLAFQQKAHILFHHMNGELDNLCSVFIHTLLPDLQEEEKTDNASPADTITLRNTIGALLTRCPVYRLYGQAMPLPDAEVAVLKVLLSDIHKENPELAPAVMLLETALLKKPSGGNADYNRKALHFFRRCMQLSGPLMAKGVEDTLMYTYNRFIGHNEVGDSPGAQGLSIAGFHQQMILRQERCPFSLNATATHDTKRGEDASADAGPTPPRLDGSCPTVA
jgi:(1->4)-alpha-D-glucan 1-alpha-D-glucosylmutase